MRKQHQTLENEKYDFIEVAILDPKSEFVTREAPGLGTNGGGGIEVVVNPNSPKLEYFHMPLTEAVDDSIESRLISNSP